MADNEPGQRFDRLHDLMDVMDQVEKREAALVTAGLPTQFDMDMWGQARERAREKRAVIVDSPDCLTTACAAAWYCILKRPADVVLVLRDPQSDVAVIVNPNAVARMPMLVLADHFGVSEMVAQDIFSPDAYGAVIGKVSPGHVRARVMRYIEMWKEGSK